jgi:drug/metabolite transporter (DMT)-like permease
MSGKEPMKQNKNAVGYFLAFLTILIWGTTFISTKVLLREFSPVEILFFRFVMGFLALIAIYPRRLRITEKKHELMIACAGLCGITLYYLLENIALTYSMASNIGVIISIAPFFTGIIAHRFLEGEKLKTNFIFGFVIAIIGICLISYNTRTAFRLNPAGDFLAELAALVWAVYSVLSRKISAFGYNTIQTTRRMFFYGLVFMAPALVLFDFRLGPERFAKPVNLLNIIFLGLGASALCFVTWNLAVKLLGAMKTSVYIYIVPVITIITSVIVLHERVTVMAALGTILTLAGLIVSESNIRLKKRALSSLKER